MLVLEAQKSRCQDLESELCNATELMATLKVELNVKRNEIETKVLGIGNNYPSLILKLV